MQYYAVEISADCKDRRGNPALSRKREYDIRKWIINAWTDDFEILIWRHSKFLVYEFNNEGFAVAFKLRWT